MGIVDPRDERLSALLAERERAGSARGVLTLRRGDGTAFQADVASVLFETAEGPRSSMVIRDITEQECAEEALRASERKYRTLIAEMSIGCALRQLVCDAAGRPIDYVTLEVNRAFETMLNVKRAEVIGRKASEFLPASELKEWLAIFGPVVLTGKTRHYEQYSPLNRKYFEGAVFCPEPGKFAVTFADVTDRKRAEEKLRDTQRIEAVGTLCAGISHEYNNILMAIAGYAHHLRAGTRKGTEARTQAERIAALAERATVVSRGLLNFSRRSPMQVKPLDFDAVVRNSLRTMRDLIGEDIEIEMRLRSKACVPADEKQIEQVVVNLILNARDAMPKGGRLTVETSRESLSEGKVHTLGLEGGRKYAMLKIRDTGFGMNKDICRKAFEPFFTTKTPEAGTGLGLSAAQGIVHSHSGAIELDSEAGKGTVATVYLPCVEGDKSRSRLRARKA
jgi:nitrogen-specific signal transduction histidine kinase